jgi:hypothetical protein
MPYYLRDMRRKCGWSTCDEWSTHALHTSGTMVYGHYCKKHGEIEKRVRNKELEKRVVGT